VANWIALSLASIPAVVLIVYASVGIQSRISHPIDSDDEADACMDGDSSGFASG
jgi:hypothetical protein